MSDIFNDYVKIMAEKGFVKEAYPMTSEDKEKDKEWQENIQALYGSPGKDIIEQAHPDSIIIAPSYDKLNGLVENLNERHNIMVGIARRNPTGTHTNHRYAKKELLDELVRLGFVLDNEGNEELSKMADYCADRLTKEAFWQVALYAAGYAIAGISTIGFIKSRIIGHLSQGIKPDAEIALKALQDLKPTVSKTHWALIDNWANAIKVIQSNLSKAESIAGNTENQQVDMDNVQLEANAKLRASKEDLDFLNKFKDMCVYVGSKIGTTDPSGMTNTGFLAQIQQMQEVQETSSEWYQWAKEYIWESTMGDNKTNAINSMAALRNSLQAFSNALNVAASEGKEALPQTQEQVMKALEGSQGPATSEYVSEG